MLYHFNPALDWAVDPVFSSSLVFLETPTYYNYVGDSNESCELGLPNLEISAGQVTWTLDLCIHSKRTDRLTNHEPTYSAVNTRFPIWNSSANRNSIEGRIANRPLRFSYISTSY